MFEILKKYLFRMTPKKELWVSEKKVFQMARSLGRKIKSSGKNYQLVVGIYRGGVPIAITIADELGVYSDVINIKSYKYFERSGEIVIKSTLKREDVEGKNVLLVDDLVDSGNTVKIAKKHLFSLGANKVDVAVLFKKVWSEVEVEYFLEETDKWVVFPWEWKEYERGKNYERRRKPRTKRI